MSEKNNKYTPNLRFPEFSGEWEETKLGEVTRNEDSKRRPISKIDRAVGEYPYYGANGIQDHVNDYIFDGDYLLVGEDGSVLTKENTPVINWASGKFWVNNHAHVLSPKDDTSLKLISYLLSGVKIDGLVTGIPPKLNQDNLNTISIPLPPSPAEQDKIASCLSAMDDLITAQAEKVEALKEKKTGLMQQLFPKSGETTPRLRFPEFIGEWEEKKLGEIGDVCMCKRIMKHETSPTGGIPFYKIGTFGKKADAFISVELFREYQQKYSYPNKGDILFSAAGTIGRCVVFDGEPAYFQDSNIVWVSNDESKVLNAFLKYIYTTIEWKIDDGGIVKRLYNDSIRKTSFWAPPTLDEQQKIASCLSTLDDQIAAETEKLTALKEHKKGLMQQLFPQPAK